MNLRGLFHWNGTSKRSKRKRPRSENRRRQPLHSPPCLEVLEDRTMPTVYTVTMATDTNPVAGPTGGVRDTTLPKAANAGDLRWCLNQADKGPGNSVVFGTQVAGQTINLQAALPDVSQSMSIAPQAGTTVTVQRSPTAGNFRIFDIEPGNNVTLGLFTIQNGQLNGTPAADIGAGIYNGGILKLNGTIVQNNTTTDGDGGGIYNGGSLTLNGGQINNNNAVNGGGIYNAGSLSTAANALLLTIRSNQASTAGAGIYNFNNAFLTKVWFDSNISQGSAGGIYTNQNLTIQNSTFSNNQAIAGDGGGIQIAAGKATINQSTFDNNSAGGQGGAIKNNAVGLANGITVNKNKVTGNLPPALAVGGGISTDVGSGISFDLVNSIVAGNTAPTNPDVDGTFTEGSSGGPQNHNFIGDGTGGNIQNGVNGDQVGTTANPLNPQLGPLQDNGGGIPTMMPASTSPVINAGDPTNAPATDERGYNRTVIVGGNPAIDIGAVESAAPTPPAVTGVMSPAAGPTAGGNNVTIGGSGFTGATRVLFGGVAATSFTVNGDSQITAVAPAEAAGTVDITVTTANGTSATSPADQYTYDAPPAVSGVSPNSGPTSGGTQVAISGSGFTGATQVYFGSVQATFTFYTDSYLVAYSPPNSAGTVDITVQTPGGTSATGSADQYTYS
jgi:hypothetical protein